MSKITTQSKTMKKSVADPTVGYHSLKPLWAKSRALLQGQSNVKAYDSELRRDYTNILLPFSPTMNAAQYAFLVAEAELPGLTAQYAKVLVSALLRKPSTLELPDGVNEGVRDWIEKDFTADGHSLFNFLDAALWEELQTSRAWVYVDHQKMSEEEFSALSQEEQNAVAPYPVLVKAESVINYQIGTHPKTKKNVLKRWITRYLVEVYEEDNPWHPNLVEEVADHYLDSAGNFVIDLYRKKDPMGEIETVNGETKKEYKDNNEHGFELHDTIRPQKFGEPLQEIPAFPLNGHIDPIEPVLMPLIDREIALYNKVTRRNHLLLGASTYTPIVHSDMQDDKFQEIVDSGLGSWIRVGPEEDITVLETPTGALADMETAITATVDEMAKLGIRMLSPEQAASGVALEIRNASQTAQLGTLNAKVSSTMASVITFMINWRYNLDLNPNDVKFQLSSDFSPIVGGEGAMRLVTEWYQSGIISRSTFLSIAKYNDFIPADYNDEEGILEIQTDPLNQGNQTSGDVPDEQFIEE